jgi:hypothetical protein
MSISFLYIYLEIPGGLFVGEVARINACTQRKQPFKQAPRVKNQIAVRWRHNMEKL